MTTDVRQATDCRDLKIATAAFIAAFVAMHLFFAAMGRSIMREQHLGTAVEFAKGRIDLLHPITLGANANDAPTILELPVWQAATAALMKLCGIWYGWGNVVSICFYLSSLWPLLQLGGRFLSERGKWWATLIYIAQPLTFLWGGMASADSTAAALSVWFCHYAIASFDSQRWLPCLAATATGILAALTKAPFFMAAGLAAFFYVLHRHRLSAISWVQLAAMGGFSVGAFALWTYHGSRCFASAEFPLFVSTFRTEHSDAAQWWFGDWKTHIDPVLWLKGLWRGAVILFGSVALGLAAIVVGNSRKTFVRWWLLAGLCTTAVFTHLVLIHWHYFFMFAAPAAMITALAAEQCEYCVWKPVKTGLRWRVFLLLAFFGANLGQGLERSSLRLHIDRYAATQGHIIKQHTPLNSKLIVWGEGWGIPFMHAERHGLTLSQLSLLEQPGNLARLRRLGFTHLVLMNRSPMEIGANMAGGKIDGPLNLSSLVPTVARAWPIVFASEHLLILKIPG